MAVVFYFTTDDGGRPNMHTSRPYYKIDRRLRVE